MTVTKVEYNPDTKYTSDGLHKLEITDLMILFRQAKQKTLENQTDESLKKLPKIMDDINLMRHILKG
jgi:hypothetical protein